MPLVIITTQFPFINLFEDTEKGNNTCGIINCLSSI